MGQQISSVATLIDDVIGREGNFSDHPADKGGATRWGVTEQVARANGYTGSMKVLPRERAAAIYEQLYWRDPGFDAVFQRYPDVAALLFDIGVNMGVGIAGTFLQRVLNVLNFNGQHYADLVADGRVGRVSILALDAFKQRRGVEGGERLWEAIHALRGARFIEISEARAANEAFTYGWFGRMVEMTKARFGK